MQSKAATVAQYLAELPPDRREMIQAVRRVILDNLDAGFQEGMQYGMICYSVPHALFPPGYHCDPKVPLPYAGLASQKHYMSLYMMALYTGPGGGEALMLWFHDAWARSGKKTDMGKSCIRFKKVDDLPLDVIGEAFRRLPAKRFIEIYEASRANALPTRKVAKKPAKKKGSKKPAAKTKAARR